MSDALSSTISGLEQFLGALWDTSVSVTDAHAASAGARRLNLLFTAHHDGVADRLVATIVPTAALQITAIDVEAAHLRMAEAAGVPVPHVIASSSDGAEVGGPFIISTAIDGETVPRRVLRLVAANPDLGPELGRQCGAALARLHAADLGECHPDVPRPSPDKTPAATTLHGLRQQLDELLTPSAAFELGYRRLLDALPDDDRVTPVHNDFRNGNLIIGSDGLRAVLDWEASGIGAPMSDLAWMCVRMWRFGNDHLPVGGFATVDDLRAGYEEAGGRWDDDAFRWWMVLGSLRWGIGLGGQVRQHIEGEFRSIVMAGSGRRIAEMEYDVLSLLA
jgi:aminoglycoside phosphotransferase (APT) family kinase protein